MTAALLISLFVIAVALVLSTVAQMLYMDASRLRARDIAFLQLFRDSIDERLGFKNDEGTLAFSLIKHTLFALLGVVMLAFVAGPDIELTDFIEACGLSWLLMLVCSYVVPQLLYRRTSGTWLLPLVPLLRMLELLVRPLTALLGFLQSLSELNRPDEASEENTSQENIEALITAGAEEGIIEEEDRKLIQSVVAFGNKTVREVMTPRPAMVTVDANASLEDLKQLVVHEQFSRIPVYEDSIDNISGFVHVRDMFELDFTERTQRSVRELARPIRFVPETKAVNDLLRDMQQDGTHMAIVIDEYGNTAGLVTMEDMVEEIVGEIRDEHEPGHDVQQDEEGGFIVSGSFDVDHLQDLVDFHPTEETESTTVGGLVTEWLGRVPMPGEAVEKDGVRIEVLGGNEMRVDQVRISKMQEQADV